MMKKPPSEFPYIVTRLMPAVYQNEIVEHFTDRQKLIEDVKARVKKARFRMCIVFGPKDAVFINPDGTVIESSNVPSGGFNL